MAVAVATHRATAAAVVREVGRDRRPDVERIVGSGTAGIFPLGFARQPVIAAGDRREPSAEFVGLVPK